MLRLSLLLLVATGCAVPPAAPSQAVPPTAPVVVYAVRHAEAASDGTTNPPLSEAGQARAARLAARLGPTRPAAVLATEYRRTQETARAVARPAGLDVTVVEVGRQPPEAHAAALAERLRAFPPGSAVVVVGHSNTIPALVTALTGTPAPTIDHDTYDHLFIVTLPAGGPGTVEDARY